MANPEITVPPPPVSKAAVQDVCASDPNFAQIFAFWERFGESCGVTIPTFQELQEMLEKTNEVPDALVDLHIKLLRRVKKTVHVDKWEKAILKFCQVYSIPEFWELERYGYKGICIQLKLKILKTLFEAQFDSNAKFKAEINKQESSMLRSQPLGWDKSGVAYWVQFDRAYNIRVYKEDIDEDIWKIVANDRNTLVTLINKLSGAKDSTLDDIEDSNSIDTSSDAEVELSPGLEQEKSSPASPETASIIVNNKIEHNINESDFGSEEQEIDSKDNVHENSSINLQRKLEDDSALQDKINNPIIGETIEESVMIVKGEGSGQECDTGNPDEVNTQNESSKNEDVKKPKLWSIEAICSSSKEVREENISVPTTGFFFGDDSVPCFNNVSNGESSHHDEEKLEVDQSKKKDTELNYIKKLNEMDSIITSQKQLDKEDVPKSSYNEKSLNKEFIENKEEFFTKNTSKQSVFNIKVHEEEVQITERKANEVFIKSDSNVKNDKHKPNVYESISVDAHDKPQESQLISKAHIFESNEDIGCNKTDNYGALDDIQHNKISDECKESGGVLEEIKCENDESSDQQSVNKDDSVITLDRQIVEQKDMCMKLEDKTEQQLEDQQLTIEIVDHAVEIDKRVFDDKIKIIEQSTSEINQIDELKRMDDICEKDKANKSPENTGNQCVEINEPLNVDIVEQNLSLNKTISDGTTTDQILTDVSNVIDKEATINSVVEDSKIDEQVCEDISKHIQTTDEPNISASNSNSNLNRHTENDDSDVDCSNSEVPDQTVVEDIDQNSEINKETLHNYRNIETDMSIVSDNATDSEQLTSAVGNKSTQLESYQIKNENNFTNNNFKEENKSVVIVDYQIASNKNHNVNEVFKKSEEIKEETLKCPAFEKETIEESKSKDKPEHFIVGNIEMDKIGLEKSEVNIKELKSNDFIEGKKVKLTVDKIQIKDIIPNVPKKIKSIDEIPKDHNINYDGKNNDEDELPSISTKRYDEDKRNLKCLEKSCKDIEPITKDIKLNKKENYKLINTENKTNISFKEKLKLGESKTISYDKENAVQDSVVQESILTIEAPTIDEKNSEGTLKDDENVTDEKIEENVEKEFNTDADTNQKLKIKDVEIEYIQDPEEENILKTPEKQIVTSPVNEAVHENADKTNVETFVGSSEEEFNDSGMINSAVKQHTKKSDEEEVEETSKKKGRPGRKKGKRGRAKKSSVVKQKIDTEKKVKRPYKPRQKKVVTIVEEVTVFPEPVEENNIRRSRRIAEIKIKEQFTPTTQYDDIDEPIKVLKKNNKGGKKMITPTKKMVNAKESDDEDEDDPVSRKFKKKKKKGKADSVKKLNMKNPWNVDSESSSSEKDIELFEDYDHEEEDEIPRPGIEPNVSDHEFSPESDINDEDEEYLPEKRARTAHKKEESEQLKDDMSCRNCNKSDQPEWILLCDTCNQGWHASCVRPPLMVIPDGDWHCPPCRHNSLLNALKDVLKKYDGESKKRENEELRRKRLAYVGISLQNVITSKTEEIKTAKPQVVQESSEEDNEEQSESDSYDSSEPLYQLRARRQTNVSYRFNDYDDMINEAILETGVDEYAVKKSAEMKTNKNDNEKTDSDENSKPDSPIAPALLHLRGRKKSKKLTNLDVSSDDGSDEDFKGPSDDDDDYEEDFSEYSDDSVKRPQPTRRSVRNRKTVIDPDFINDDSSEDSDKRSKKKRSRTWSDSSNSEEEDFTWGKKKNKQTNAPSTSSFSFKQSKESKRKNSQNDSFPKHKKSKIKYGMDSDSDSKPQRRTRGRQITYVESDDSEEEVTTKKRKIASDEEDEYVLNDEELEIENEDRNLEVDDDDTVASNEEKDEEAEEEEAEVASAVVDEENEEEDSPKPAIAIIAQPMDAKLPPITAIVQSVIKEPITTTSVINITEDLPSHTIHQRLLPPVAKIACRDTDKQIQPHLSVDPVVVGMPEKRKRPSNQLKKSPSPSVDYSNSGGIYPYPLGATNVVSAVPPISSIHVAYNRPSDVSAGELKPLPVTLADPPSSLVGGSGGFSTASATYRIGNKIIAPPVTTTISTSPAYQLPPQQVYNQAPLQSANYSPYPIDYVTPGTQLPPPPPAIAFRNVIVASPPLTSSHEPSLPSVQQQQSTITTGMVAGGDSEFGGLVSYFSSQQEDDFDT